MTTPNSAIWYSLRPTDAWFFRDGKPFNRGELQSDLRSVFPPPPKTIIGAIRAGLARSYGWSGRGDWPQHLKDVLGDGFDDLGRLTFFGPFLCRDDAPLFPVPRHLVGVVSRDRGYPEFLASGWLTPSPPVRCDLGDIVLPLPPFFDQAEGCKPAEPGDDFFLTSEGMRLVIEGQLPGPQCCVHKSLLFRNESRIAIQRDAVSRTVGQAGMYSPGYVRLASKVTLAVGIAGIPELWAMPSLLMLGGESRMAGCVQMAAPPDTEFADCGTAGPEDCVLISLSPARFSVDRWFGAAPGHPASYLSPGLGGEVVTTTVDRPLRQGGWDSRTATPMPMRPLIPPGSVWWLEQSPSGPPSRYISLGEASSCGLGQAVIARLPAAVQ